MADYSQDTGDRLLEHYADKYAKEHGVPMEVARAMVDCSPAIQGLLGRNGNELNALVLAGIATDKEKAVYESEMDAWAKEHLG